MLYFKSLTILIILFFSIQIDSFSLTFTVTSPEDDEYASAYDDIGTKADESKDGVCGDTLGRCTLRAALEELDNVGDTFGNEHIVIISVQSIVLMYDVYIPNNVKFMASPNTNVTITVGGENTAILGGDDIEFRNINIESNASGISLGSNCSVENCNIETDIMNGIALEVQDNCTIKNVNITAAGVGVSIGWGNQLDSINIVGKSGIGGISINGDNNILTNIKIGDDGKSFMTGIQCDGNSNQIMNSIVSYYTFTGIAFSSELTGNIIKNCTIGDIASGGTRIGVMLLASETIIENNEIIGNGMGGVSIGFGESTAVKNIIRNNFIGCKRDLSQAGNSEGIQIMSNDNKIEDNIIVYNTNNGIYLSSVDKIEFGTVIDNIISGNSIGGIEGNQKPMPNGMNGILILGSVEDNIIGASIDKEYLPNYIANNQRYGIYVQSIEDNYGLKNAFRKNVITNNEDLGIKIDENSQQNIKPPKLDSLVNGKLYGHDGIPGSKIDIYETDLDNSGSGEGKKWIKEFTINNQAYSFELGPIPQNGISATLTNTTNSTSEFSCNIPSIQSFQKELELTFIDGISLNDNNKHTVIFYPGREITDAKYKINDAGWQTATVSGNTAIFTVKMGSGFKPDYDNKLYFSSIGCNGFQDTMLLHPKVVRMREYAGPVGDYITIRQDPELKYKKNSKVEWPKPNLNISFSIPAITPYIGGDWGLKETGLKFDFEVSSLGTVIEKTIEVNGGFGLGEKQYNLIGNGNVSNSLFPSGLKTDGTINANLPIKLWEKEENLLSIIPAASTLCDYPLGSEICAFLNSLVHAGVRASITLDLGGNADFRNNGDVLEWTSGALTSTLTLSVVGSANLAGAAGFTIEGSGSGTLVIPFPSLEPQVSGSLTFRAFGQIAGVGSISGDKTWSIGGGIIQKDDEIISLLKNDLPNDSDYKVISNNSPFDANANMCKINNQKHAVVWSETALSKDSPSRDIKLAIFSNNILEKTINLTNDEKNNRNPKVICNNDKLIIIWEYNELPASTLNTLKIKEYVTTSFLKYSILNTSDLSIISSGNIDNPKNYDFSPKFVQNSSGLCQVIWQSSNGETIVGNSDNKVAIFSSEFSGTQFKPAIELFTESGLLQWNTAMTNDGSLFVTYEKDFDNKLQTAEDREIMLFSYINSNKQTTQITNNNSLDMTPIIASKSNNQVDIAFAKPDGVYLVQNGESNKAEKILDENVGLNFSKAEFIIGNNTKTIVWNGARGFYSINQDQLGKWSELRKTKDYNYVNILNSITSLDNGKVLALFQKFDNRNKSVLLESNDLVVSILNFENVNTGIEDIGTNSETLLLYPNPVGDYLEIKNPENQIIIYSALGELLIRTGTIINQPFKLDLRSFVPGIYFIKSGEKVGKFVKI